MGRGARQHSRNAPSPFFFFLFSFQRWLLFHPNEAARITAVLRACPDPAGNVFGHRSTTDALMEGLAAAGVRRPVTVDTDAGDILFLSRQCWWVCGRAGPEGFPLPCSQAVGCEAGAGDHLRHCRRIRRGPRQGHGAPRHQAGEHSDGAGRGWLGSQDRRLRHRGHQGVEQRLHPHRGDSADHGLRRPRAVTRSASRRTRRPDGFLRPRRSALRDAYRADGLPRRKLRRLGAPA